MAATATTAQSLSRTQQAIVPIAAATAVGDMPQLLAALNRGLDAGMTVSDAEEVLVQLYAYAGFPRRLNGLVELMNALDARQQRGVRDTPGREPVATIPTGKALLERGKTDEWDRMIDVNLRGVLHGIAAALPFMKQQKAGHITNTGSVAAYKLFPAAEVYCATQFAVRALTEGLRQETKP